ncbi:MAG: hypothetical protein J1D85_01450 [Bacteroidales bacterium]|nr:hypothetical protein [Bacteroidales bacterium]
MLPVAKILKSNGTCGDILAGFSVTEISEIDTREPVFIEFDGLPVPFFIESLTPKGASRAIIHLTDVENLRDAEELVGREILIDAEEDDSEENDFIGWTLYNRDEPAGEISGMELIPGNPCLCIGTALVPLNEDLIVSADPEKRILVMDLPDGLL